MTEPQTTLAARDEPISVGEVAPPFALPAVLDGGEEITVELAEQVKQGRVMLIFYQDDGMPICTRELQAFAQEHALLKGAGVQVFGMNTNGIGDSFGIATTGFLHAGNTFSPNSYNNAEWNFAL